MNFHYRALDRERQKFHKFLVMATDGGKNEARQTSVPVEIEVSDVNDNHPIFEEYPFKARVPVTTQPGHGILRVKANDLDEGINGDIVYSFSHEQEKSKFRIHITTGTISATAPLTEEEGQVYRLEVIATDRGNPPLSSRGLVEFHMGDLPDSAPVLKFQNNSYELAVHENLPAGTDLIQVTAVRSDGRRQQIVYSIGSGNDLQIFHIDEKSGLLRIENPGKLDAELCCTWNKHWNGVMDINQAKEQTIDATGHMLTVVAKTIGSDPLEAYAKLLVQIIDLNDNPPIFTQTQYLATVLEGNSKGDFVFQVIKGFYT